MELPSAVTVPNAPCNHRHASLSRAGFCFSEVPGSSSGQETNGQVRTVANPAVLLLTVPPPFPQARQPGGDEMGVISEAKCLWMWGAERRLPWDLASDLRGGELTCQLSGIRDRNCAARGAFGLFPFPQPIHSLSAHCELRSLKESLQADSLECTG